MKSCVVSMTGDPATIGHLDIISRAAKMFDMVYVLVAKTSSKPGALLTYEDKCDILRDAVSRMAGKFEILPIDGALVDQAKSLGATAIVRGLRNELDLVYETDMCAINRCIQPDIETIYLPCRPELSYVSSSSVRELMRLGKFETAAKFTTEFAFRTMKRKLSIAVAITGGIGSGKSAVQSMFRDSGWNVIDCDDINRTEVLPLDKKGSVITQTMLDRYGVDVLTPDRSRIDCKALADLVFSNKRAKSVLEAIAYPIIYNEVERFITSAQTGTKIAVQVPLLFEPGTEKLISLFDHCICITASDETRRHRLKTTRGYSDEEIDRRFASQMPQDEKARLCKTVISNDNTLDELRHSISLFIARYP